MEKNLVSVIMNCFNGEQYLREAIESVLCQTYEKLEIIFWNNASTDNSKDIVFSYDDKRIKYYESMKTVNVYTARNFALSKCKGEFIAFLDTDDLWLSQKLEKQIPLFENKDVGLVFSDSIFFNNYGNERRNYSAGYPNQGYCFEDLLLKYHLDIETVVLRHSLLLDNNLKFNDKYNCAGDADLFLSVAHLSKIACVKDVLAKWRIHENSITSTQKKRFIDEERNIILKLKMKFQDENNKYEYELSRWKRRLDIRELFIIWENDGPIYLIKKVFKSRLFNKYTIILIFLSFIPYRVAIYIYKKFKPI